MMHLSSKLSNEYSQNFQFVYPPAIGEAIGMTRDPSWPACSQLSRQDAATLSQWLDATHEFRTMRVNPEADGLPLGLSV